MNERGSEGEREIEKKKDRERKRRETTEELKLLS